MSAGIELSRAFFERAVRPVLSAGFAELSYSAALIGPGSEVLGFDDQRSQDHDWGPRLLLFLDDAASSMLSTAIEFALDAELPGTFEGFPVRFPDSHGGVHRHHVEVVGRAGWFNRQLGFDPLEHIDTVAWLSAPTQRLAECTAGAVFLDGPGTLESSRAALSWYPEDVWRWLLGCQWERIAQEGPFAGRCVETGDDLGAVVVTARLARDVMRLWLLMSRVYPPYSKWLGSAFGLLPDTADVADDLIAAIQGGTFAAREHHLGRALQATVRRQNELGLCDPQPDVLRPFHDRPFLVVAADSIGAVLRASVHDPLLRGARPIGAVDHFVDSTDALGSLQLTRAAIVAGLIS